MLVFNGMLWKLLPLERGDFTYSKNDSFKVVGGYFAMNTPFNPPTNSPKNAF
ncbi:hypothetical protein [Helicobacter pylori]|uniref:hypothetical protein n=1 Tax=Helicobacter pylori TaxID=210 RepID=UPI001F0CD1F4|nr:hypothetical protein [Helicobacter pylori]